jgi:hypothetical protein
MITSKEIEQKKNVIEVCDDCLDAAYDTVDARVIEVKRKTLETICTTMGDDIPDHRCLKTSGFQDRCDCLCHH